MVRGHRYPERLSGVSRHEELRPLSIGTVRFILCSMKKTWDVARGLPRPSPGSLNMKKKGLFSKMIACLRFLFLSIVPSCLRVTDMTRGLCTLQERILRSHICVRNNILILFHTLHIAGAGPPGEGPGNTMTST